MIGSYLFEQLREVDRLHQPAGEIVFYDQCFHNVSPHFGLDQSGVPQGDLELLEFVEGAG